MYPTWSVAPTHAMEATRKKRKARKKSTMIPSLGSGRRIPRRQASLHYCGEHLSLRQSNICTHAYTNGYIPANLLHHHSAKSHRRDSSNLLNNTNLKRRTIGAPLRPRTHLCAVSLPFCQKAEDEALAFYGSKKSTNNGVVPVIFFLF